MSLAQPAVTILRHDIPQPGDVDTSDGYATTTVLSIISTPVIGEIEQTIARDGSHVSVDYTAHINLEAGNRTGAAAIEADDPAVLSSLAAVSELLARELRRLRG